MTEIPDPAGYETRVDKEDAAGAQGAVDATVNAFDNDEIEDARERLREELEDAGVFGMPEAWVAAVAERIEAGEPVVVEVAEE